MAIAIIGRALLRVLQAVIGFVDFLELRFGLGIAGVLVRMPLHRELAVGRFQLAVAYRARDAQDFVVVALGHQQAPFKKMAFVGCGESLIRTKAILFSRF
jgi:hypothetical protein